MSTVFQESEDLFGNLPDEILLTIFDKVEDAKSLCISSSLCKRFHFLITQTHNISLTIQPQKQNEPSSSLNSSSILGFLSSGFLKPFQFLLRQINILNPILSTQKKCAYSCCTCSYASPAENLRSFPEIKNLEIRLPSPPDDQSLLKWKAEFGSQLKNCLIVGGTSISPVRENHERTEQNDSMEFESFRFNRDETCVEESVRVGGTSISPVRENRERTERNDSMEFESFRSDRDETIRITNDELKLRIVWTISCLIAASARHCLLEETIKEKKTINRVVITDDMGQGKCCMNSEQLEEMRRNTAVISSNRSKLPALKVKMWYVPELELPVGGCVVKGATLVVVRPVEEWSKADDGGDLVSGGFSVAEEGGEEKVFDEVAREMVKLKSSYTLEMNSF